MIGHNFTRHLFRQSTISTNHIDLIRLFSRQLPSMSGTANLDGMAPNGVTKPIISSGSMAAQQHVQIFTNIEKSKIDTRQYRGVRLSNGLRILLISDPKTDKSSAALDVNVGSLSDPIKLQGLSHFLEHMLFLGTEKVIICCTNT